MRELIQVDPDAALAEAMSWEEYASLPDEIQGVVEQPFAAMAPLTVEIVCPVMGQQLATQSGESGVSYSIELDGDRVTAYPAQARKGMTSKSVAAVTGIRVDDVAALDARPTRRLTPREAGAAYLLFGTPQPEQNDGEVVLMAGGKILRVSTEERAWELGDLIRQAEVAPGPDTVEKFFEAFEGDPSLSAGELTNVITTATSAWTETPKKMLFIRVRYSGEAGEPVGQITLQNTLSQVATSISQMSYGKTTILPTVTPKVYTLNSRSVYETNENYYGLINDAIAAASADYMTGNFDILVACFPDTYAGWGGRATVGGDRQWLNGYFSQSIIVHETGHNYGLMHANFWETASGVNPAASAGTNIEYGDPFDEMGGKGEFNMRHKARLNWITTGDYKEVTAPGTFRIYRFDHQNAAGSGSRLLALKVKAPPAEDRVYWVGYRQDTTEFNTVPDGAYILWDPSETSNEQTRLLDMTPSSNADSYLDRKDAFLKAGETFTSPNGTLTIRTVAVGGQEPDQYVDISVGGIDTQAPALSITSHQGNQTVNQRLVKISGSASDSGRGNSGIASVKVNGQPAKGGVSVERNSAAWNYTAQLFPGANNFIVVAKDGAGNEAQRELLLDYVPLPPDIVTDATLKPGSVGKLQKFALAANSGEEPYIWVIQSGSLPPGYSMDAEGNITGLPEAPGVSQFTVFVTGSNGLSSNKTFTLEVLPSNFGGAKPGTISLPIPDGAKTWVASSSASWIRPTKPTGSGPVRIAFDKNPSTTGRSATVTVNGKSFEFNQLGSTVGDLAVGLYAGPVGEIGSLPPANPLDSPVEAVLSQSGWIQLMLTAPNKQAPHGSFTATLVVFDAGRTVTYRGRGRLDENGGIVVDGSANPLWKGSDKTTVAVTLQLEDDYEVGIRKYYHGNFVVSGGNSAEGELLAGKLVFNKKLNPYPEPGVQTFIGALDGGGALVAPDLDGSSFASVKIDAAGLAAGAGKTADGGRLAFRSSVWAATGVSGENVLLIYSNLNKGTGIFGGWLRMKSANLEFDWSGPGRWTQADRSAKGLVFAGGFDVTLNLGMSAYLPASKTMPILSWTGTSGLLSFADGGLASPFEQSISLSGTSSFLVESPNPNAVSIKLTTATGLLRGQFVDPQNGAKRTVEGILNQKAGTGAGFFLTPSAIGRFTLAEDP
ncbi:MAG: hypothetical protein Fur0032_08390 [Terrimicrobiaceae bacterium]